MKIKKIHMCSMGVGNFYSRCAVVETEDGQFYQYMLDISGTWTDEADYMDNVRTDFIYESNYPDHNFTNGEGLFLQIINDEDLKYWHEEWLKEAVRKTA
jgi:hypothetical protein